MRKRIDRTTWSRGGSTKLVAMAIPALMMACGAPGIGESSEGQVDTSAEAATVDGLSDAYASFKTNFQTSLLFDQRWFVGYGFHPGLSTEKLTGAGSPPKGTIVIDFAAQLVNATLFAAPAGVSFDLWFVKNVAGSGRTVKPETGDQFVKVGSFGAPTAESFCFGTANCVSIDNLSIGNNVNFDLDMIVVTRQGQHPTASRIAVGARTLFEKRFFRERAGKTLDPVSGTLANNVETTDQLVARGAQLFFNETFGGNGRTCGTCHRAEDNLTIDVPLIATLPKADPLFVAENNPALAQLEDKTLLRTKALVRENTDGFEDPTHKFVARSVNHTFSLGLTNGIGEGLNFFPFAPPDHRLGWSGDGAPGRGTLNDFAFGAIIQHFTKRLNRVPGTDFRIPTQEELDALEAFQLFTGRQKAVNVANLQFRESRATLGRSLFFGNAQCIQCHTDINQVGVVDSFNGLRATGVASLTPTLPVDDGFLQGIQPPGRFNIPPVLEAADTAPLFHNNAAADIEAAVAFYVSPNFRMAPDGFFIDLTAADQANIAAFLRVLNAAENVRQVRKRVQFVKSTRSAGNTSLLTIAIADAQDAIDVLTQKGLNSAAVNELADVRQTLQIAQANPDANRPAFMDHALVFLDLIRKELFTANPDNQF